MSTGSKGSGGHLSNGSTAATTTTMETNGNHSDADDLDTSGGGAEGGTTTSGSPATTPGVATDATEAWWSVGEYLDGTGRQVTHQSAKLSLTGNRVFTNQKEEMWDLTDSLAELYEVSQKFEMMSASSNSTLHLSSGGGGGRRARNMSPAYHHHHPKETDIREWLQKDNTNGFIRVYPSTSTGSASSSQLVPCSLSTSAHKLCLVLGISINALHVQLNGDIIRRVDPYEHPLVIQNEYLAALGYQDLKRIQEEGVMANLAYLIKFFSGKPVIESTFSRNQLQAFIEIKKNKVMSQWAKKLCVLSGTRLLVYKDHHKRSDPSVFQLAKGSIEECPQKGHDRVIKVTSTLQGEKIIFLSFPDQPDYLKWFRRFKKATDKLPTAADLSNCHLEFLPETIFINDQLAMLNLRHNVLKERPIDEDIYTIGWLDDLPRFSRLRSLNLADNNLAAFPLAVCYIKTLVELNVASNKLEELPIEIGELTNLQALHAHNNHLTSIPIELLQLRQLFIFVLAFNRFATMPPVVAQMTDVRVSEVENIIMAGNEIESLSADVLTKMKYVKKVDFRMNKLTLTSMETLKLTALEHLSHLDLRDNHIPELDIRPLRTLEYLNVERNGMTSLQLNGMALKNLFAGYNELEKLVVTPKPEWLLQADVSYNNLRRIPDWLSDCFFLQKLNVSHNLLVELPPRMLTDAKKLKSLKVNHNRLLSLPAEVDLVSLEELYIQNNCISRLPNDLLRKANKLRVLNGTKNRLTMLPPLNDNQDLNKVQELYLTGNSLGDGAMEVISGYRRLKVLHMADNEIHNLFEKDLHKLEFLQELNVSTNQLRHLPEMLGGMARLVILRAHSNVLQNLPELKAAKALRILDVGHNQLLNVSVTNLMASQIDMLDMSLNAQLRVDPRAFRTIKHKKSICLVDLTGQNRLLPGLHRRRQTIEEEEEADSAAAWKVGFSETSGMRNKLCIATLKILKFRNENEAVFGMFDGGHNNEVPKQLLDTMPEIIQEELNSPVTQHHYMKYAMLSAHRRLKGAGQRLGATAAVCHLINETSNRASQINQKRYTLQLANVGDIEVVLCRRGEATLLSHCHVTTEDREECARVYSSDGIITEDNKVNGTTENTRALGVSYLYPHVIPEPFTCSVDLRHHDEFIIVANRGLWKFVDYNEAVQEIYDIGNPVVAAKKLQDLAQGYGSKENIGVMVVRLNTDQGPSLARLRQHRSMSIDDIEAAAQHEIQKHKLLVERQERGRERMGASTGELDSMRELAATTTPAAAAAAAAATVGTVAKHRSGSKRREIVDDTDTRDATIDDTTTTGTDITADTTPPALVSATARAPTPPPPPSPPPPPLKSESDEVAMDTDLPKPPANMRQNSNSTGLSDELAGSSINDTPKNQMDKAKDPNFSAKRRNAPPIPPPAPLPDLKPLPNQKFRKKNIATEWETILQKRLTDDVKDKELKQLGRSVSEESVFKGEQITIPINLDELDGFEGGAAENRNGSRNGSRNGNGQIAGSITNNANIETRAVPNSQHRESSGTLRKRMMTPPWYNRVEKNAPVASYDGPHNNNSTTPDKTAITTDKRPKVRKTIAMFENMGRDDEVTSPTTGGGFYSPPQRRTVVTLERDERSPLNNVTFRNGAAADPTDLSTPKVDIQTVGGRPRKVSDSGGKGKDVNGSVEGNLYPDVRKVTKAPDQNHNSETAIEPEAAEVTIVEIARL